MCVSVLKGKRTWTEENNIIHKRAYAGFIYKEIVEERLRGGEIYEKFLL